MVKPPRWKLHSRKSLTNVLFSFAAVFCLPLESFKFLILCWWFTLFVPGILASHHFTLSTASYSDSYSSDEDDISPRERSQVSPVGPPVYLFVYWPVFSATDRSQCTIFVISTTTVKHNRTQTVPRIGASFECWNSDYYARHFRPGIFLLLLWCEFVQREIEIVDSVLNLNY